MTLLSQMVTHWRCRTNKIVRFTSFRHLLPLQRCSFASNTNSGFHCDECGQLYAKWQGQCSVCDAWSTIAPHKEHTPLYRQSNASSYMKSKSKVNLKAITSSTVAWAGSDRNGGNETSILRMQEVQMDAMTERIALSDRELNWVLGGGLVSGSLTLLAGNPGIGKSTLALQIANMLANTTTGPQHRHVLYVSGEESILQVKMRADRLQTISPHLYVASETNLDSVFVQLESAASTEAAFDAVVVDSIQTMYADDVPSPAGSVTQVKECTLRLLRFAKQLRVPVIIIGHVTKSGDIAGPKVLEHIVDTVVQVEGEVSSSRRFVRCLKNRFGTTSEVGVFSMTDTGLQPLVNPLLAFIPPLSSTTSIDGASLTIAMEGTRPIPLEIQALANRSQFSSSVGGGSSRVRGVGISFDKLQVLFAVLEKRCRLSFYSRNVFVNVAEGYTIQEPASDLAIAIALASAVLNRPVRKKTLFLGELALSGHVRAVKLLETRLNAAYKIGLETAVVPTVQCRETQKILEKYKDLLVIEQVSTVQQALEFAFDDKDQVH